jgi:hypothetical protein
MPNWCHDVLTVTGDPEKIEAFAEKVKMTFEDGSEQPLTFAVHVPEPSEEERSQIPSDMCEGGWDWYGWRLSNWGTKWDASFDHPVVAIGSDTMDVDRSTGWNGVARLDERTLVYKFTTAWSPPGSWAQKASADEPDLEFVLTFAEPGGGYAGRVKVVSGMLIEEEDLEVSDVLEPEEMWF